jgi:hypothetical protein
MYRDGRGLEMFDYGADCSGATAERQLFHETCNVVGRRDREKVFRSGDWVL